MLSNPKTSIPGLLILVGAVANLIAHAVNGNFGAADIGSLMGALSGIGLIAAQDGRR